MPCFGANKKSSFMQVDGIDERHSARFYFVFLKEFLKIYFFYYFFLVYFPVNQLTIETSSNTQFSLISIDKFNCIDYVVVPLIQQLSAL